MGWSWFDVDTYIYRLLTQRESLVLRMTPMNAFGLVKVRTYLVDEMIYVDSYRDLVDDAAHGLPAPHQSPPVISKQFSKEMY